jgi:lipopolysaccharide export system protein LptA
MRHLKKVGRVHELGVAAAAVLVLAAATSAQAQLARNSKAPVDITADQLELVNSQCSAIYRGGAEALQETSRLRADQQRSPADGGDWIGLLRHP